MHLLFKVVEKKSKRVQDPIQTPGRRVLEAERTRSAKPLRWELSKDAGSTGVKRVRSRKEINKEKTM